MNLSELLLNRWLYKTPQQNLETKDAVYDAANVIPEAVPAIASGGAAQDINMGNVTINGGQLTPGTVPQTTLDVSNWGWGQTCAFSITGATQVNWGAGTFTSAGGIAYSISAGNTGVMSAKTYIYLDLNVSSTAYQITTTPATAVGIGKVLVAVAQNDVTTATYNLSEASQIVGDNILANSINASKITTGQLIVGTNVGQGTAVTSGGVTTIIGNTVTTGYVNALSVVAGSVAAENITGTTITGKTLQTASSGQRIVISNVTDDIQFYDSGGSYCGQMYGIPTGYIGIAGDVAVAIIAGGANAFTSSTNNISWLNLIPSANLSKDLGSSSRRWSTLYSGVGNFSSTISASNFSGSHSGNSSGTNTGNETASSILAITGGSSGTTTLNVRRVTTLGVDSGWYALTFYNGILTNAVVR
jgi:hypothetical protein